MDKKKRIVRVFPGLLIMAGLLRLICLSLCGAADFMYLEEHQSVAPQDGDIVFHESNSRQSPVIKLVQHSKWTHCGIVFHIVEKAYVYEAVEPVKYTPLEDWIARGKNGVYCAKRLKDTLPVSTIAKMKSVGAKYKGKHYDTLFQWSDNKMYCSELVWKIYAQGAGIELCETEKFSDFPISNPLVKKLIKERYGDTFDPKGQVVSPYAIYKSKLLKEVRYSGL
jgi:uncharacterized protein YycO